MLAVPPSPRHATMSQPAHSQPRNLHVPSPQTGEEDTLCAGCSKSVNSETGGVVVAFGSSLWHVDCFKCAKCGNTVDANTTLLLLSDGSPVCSNCYNCKVCNLPILDEAVMTGEDSYHAACFTCRTCHNRIDELIFAKTSQGFYCMNCHHERVARSRRHQARQQQKEKDRQASRSRSGRGPSGSGSTRSRDGTAGASNGIAMTPSRSEFTTPPPPGSDDHGPTATALHPPPPHTYTPGPTNLSTTNVDPDTSFGDMSIMSTTSAADATIVDSPVRRVAIPPSIDIPQSSTSLISGMPSPSLASSSTTPLTKAEREAQRAAGASQGSDPPLHTPPPPLLSPNTPPRPSIDIAPPPPYSVTPPSDHVSSGSSPAQGRARAASSSTDRPRAAPQSSASSSSSHRPEPPTGSNDAASVMSNGSMDLDYYLQDAPRGGMDTLPVPLERGGEHDGGVQYPVGLEPMRRRKSYDDGVRPLPSLVATGSSSTATSTLAVPNARDKRRSITPGFQLDAAKLESYRASGPSSSSPSSSTASAPSTPTGSHGHARTLTPPLRVDGRDSPRPFSPLRESFTQESDGDRRISGASSDTTFYSPSSSPQPQQPRPESSNSVRSVSTSGHTNQSPSPAAKEMLSLAPQRSDSLRNKSGPRPLPSITAAAKAGQDNATASSATTVNGRLSPNHAPHLKQKRSFEERRTREDGGVEVPIARSISLSRKVSDGIGKPDVPSGVGSESDTEGDGESEQEEYGERVRMSEDSGSTAPEPPPKDTRLQIKHEDVLVDRQEPSPSDSPTSAEAGDDLGDLENDSRGVTPSPPISPVHRQSAFFIAPALPPIRFSMSETDFSDILKSVGGPGSAKPLPKLSEGHAVDFHSPATSPSEGGHSESDSVPTPSTPPSTTSTLRANAAASSSSHDTSLETTPRPVTRKISRKGRIGNIPEALVVDTDRSKPLLNRQGSNSSVSPSSERGDVAKESPRRGPKSLVRSPSTAKSPGFDVRPPSRQQSDDMAHSDSPSHFMQVHEGLSRERSISTPSKHVNGRNHLLHAPGGSTPRHGKQDAADLVSKRLKEALANASERGVDYVKLDRGFVDAILMAVDQKKEQVHELSGKLDGLKRTSKQIMDGMSVAQEEYDKELSARRTAEAEVSRLRVELSGQTARLTAMSGDDRRRELQQQMTKELSDNLGDLERDVSKLRVERDMTLAEVEELSASKSSPIATEAPAANLSRSLTMRLDNIKRQYQKDLIPLTQQREVLMREILELKEARDIFLEETTVLNARNEELAELNAQYERRLDLLQPTDRKVTPPQNVTPPKSMDTSKSRQGGVLAPAISTTSTTSSGTLIEDNLDLRPPVKQQKSDSSDSAGQQRPRGIGIRWMGNKANKELSPLPQIFDIQKPKSRVEHAFQQLSVLRFARCDHCGDKMWGSQLRCSTCNIAVHVRCVNNVQASCAHESSSTSREESSAPAAPLPPSMFGRNLIEQVLADSATKGGLRTVPVIVEKCIDAVEALGMDYEGIYRKTGGSGQSKSITQLFERGDYDSFDLRDSDLFNDISSVTSVLKNYFRALPDPLLTYSLHEGFVSAASIREPTRKAAELTSLVAQLPKEHYHTLCHLMLHLHRVQLQSDVNRMNARNLGVVFGPTLMRSQDVAREFADMAGKALSIEWLVENAPVVFSNTIPQS